MEKMNELYCCRAFYCIAVSFLVVIVMLFLMGVFKVHFV